MTPSFEPARKARRRFTPQAPGTEIAPCGAFCTRCLGAGSNRRPLPLQGNALPTELPKQMRSEMNACMHFLRMPLGKDRLTQAVTSIVRELLEFSTQKKTAIVVRIQCQQKYFYCR